MLHDDENQYMTLVFVWQTSAKLFHPGVFDSTQIYQYHKTILLFDMCYIDVSATSRISDILALEDCNTSWVCFKQHTKLYSLFQFS